MMNEDFHELVISVPLKNAEHIDLRDAKRASSHLKPPIYHPRSQTALFHLAAPVGTKIWIAWVAQPLRSETASALTLQ
jgi:hypothetical protein